MKTASNNVTKTIVARCEKGEDLYTSLDRIAKENGIRSGFFQVIGAVSRAKIGVYKDGSYVWTERNEQFEISSCSGNVTVKEGKPFVHCHIVLTNPKGETIGGHVGEGCAINPTAEIHLQVLADPIKRKQNPDTGFWAMDV